MGVTDTVPVCYLLDGRRPLLRALTIVPRVSFSSSFSVVSRFFFQTFSKFISLLANQPMSNNCETVPGYRDDIYRTGLRRVDRSRNVDDIRSHNASTQRSDIVLRVPAKIKNDKIPKLGKFVRLRGAISRKNRCLYVRTRRERVFDESLVR